MNNYCKELMQEAWQEWHIDFEPDDVPPINPSFKRGFEDGLNAVLPILELALPHVKASAGAEHMLDGFGKRKIRPSDILVRKIEQLVKGKWDGFFAL